MECKQIDDELVLGRLQSICAEFLGGFWEKASYVSVQKIIGGLTNTMYLVSLPGSSTSPVLVRYHGGEYSKKDNTSHPMCEASEDVVFYALAQANLGPGLLGVFPGGRIEQYIPSRRISYKDFEDPVIVRTLGRKIAAYHSLDLPVSKVPIEFFRKRMKAAFETVAHLNREQFLATVDEGDLEKAKFVFSLDYLREYDWLQNVLLKLNSRVVFCHNDLNMGNVLIRTEPSVAPEDKVLIVDMEHSFYHQRGWDIAAHFTYRCFDFTDFANLISGQMFPTEAERRLLIREYIEHWKELVEKSLVNEDLDNEDHVLMEVDFYSLRVNLLHSLIFLHFIASGDIKKRFNNLPAFEYTEKRMLMYFKMKEELLLKFPQFK